MPFLADATNSCAVPGTSISFHGLVMVDKQVRVLPLSPAFPCNDSELNRRPLYIAFQAARHLLSCIKRDAATLVGLGSSLPAIPGSRRRLPNVSGLQQFPDNNKHSGAAGQRIHFEILDRFMTGLQGDHLLYLASTTNPNTPDTDVILIKFSKSYSLDLHSYCNSIGHAVRRSRAARACCVSRLDGCGCGWTSGSVAVLRLCCIPYCSPPHCVVALMYIYWAPWLYSHYRILPLCFVS